MATRALENVATGERFLFTDEGTDAAGRVRVVTYELRPGARLGAHRHPGHVQTFRVIRGRLHVRVDGRSLVLGPGDTAACSRGGVHRQWNEGPVPVVVEEAFEPPLDIEPFFTVLARAAERGELLRIGVLRHRLKFGVLMRDHRHVVVPASPAARALIALLGALGSLLGYDGWYREDLPGAARGPARPSPAPGSVSPV